MLKPTERLNTLKASETGEIQNEVLKLEAEGHKVIKLHIGEPDLATPSHIVNAGARALKKGMTKYGHGRGLKELREAIALKFEKEQHLLFDPEKEVIITSGAKQAIFETLLALLDPLAKEGVVILNPAWVSYKTQVLVAGGEPLFLDTSISNFHLNDTTLKNLDDLIRNYSGNVKAIIINSPANPTGVIYGEKELKELAKIVKKYDLAVISDEIYDKIVFDGKTCRSIAAMVPEIADNVIIINGFSKTYAMTGLRVGYAAGRTPIIEGIAKIHSANQTHPSIPEQYAALEALRGPQKFIENSRRKFEERRNIVAALLKKMNVNFFMPEGAFYVFTDIRQFIGKRSNKTTIASSSDLAKLLLTQVHVSTVPGSAFGLEGWLRISFATDAKDLKKGLESVNSFLKELK